MKFVHATINRRFWAFVIDMIALYVLDMCVGAVLVVFGVTAHFPEWLAVTMGIIFILINLFFLPLCEMLYHGQTPGKKCLGLRTVRTDGSAPSSINYLQRFLVLPFDTVFTFGMGGLITMLVTDKRQRLGDLAADTMVVRNQPQIKTVNEIASRHFNELNEFERRTFTESKPYPVVDGAAPLSVAEEYRGLQAKIAQLRTHKAHHKLIEMFEHTLADMHVKLFQRTTMPIGDLAKTTLQSVPRAIYESRWCILLSLAIAVIATVIGVYSQYTDPDFFRRFLGEGYYQMTVDNIANGNPMGVYSSMESWDMFWRIFLNNFKVELNLYVFGLFILVGPLVFLINNFVVVGVFESFFAQQGLLTTALLSLHEHGTLELASIIITGGAAIRLGTGWMFPGKHSRLSALARGARHSLLVFLSTVPMILVAAVIECFITRYTEWPISVKLSIIASSIFIIVYYVMLPILAKGK